MSIRYCPELLLGIDFFNLNSSSIKFNIEHCGIVTIDFILFEKDIWNHQVLSISFVSVEKVVIRDLYIEESLDVSFEKTKIIDISGSTFKSLSAKSIKLKNAKSLQISNCIFFSPSSGAFSVDQVETINVTNNTIRDS